MSMNEEALSKLLEDISMQPTSDPAHETLNELVKILEQEQDELCKAFLSGLVCTVALKSIINNFSETDAIIQATQNQNIKQMLLGVQHARMNLSTF